MYLNQISADLEDKNFDHSACGTWQFCDKGTKINNEQSFGVNSDHSCLLKNRTFLCTTNSFSILVGLERKL